jgi:hypothetical protein
MIPSVSKRPLIPLAPASMLRQAALQIHNAAELGQISTSATGIYVETMTLDAAGHQIS